MTDIDRTTCPYCEKEFENENKKGVHMAEEHVDSESNITKSKGQHNPNTNIMKDKWKTGKNHGEA